MDPNETAALEETKIKAEEEARLKAEREAREALAAEVKRKADEPLTNFRKQTQTQLFKLGFSVSQAVRIHKGEGSSISEIMNWTRMRYGGK
jgi:phenylalanyl-tRNA synthetase alpha subunit